MKYLLTVVFSFFLISCSSTENRESAGQYLDSSAISTKIKSKLLSNSKTSGLSIDVESYKGVVILSGFVGSEMEKEKALELAKATKGVRDVKDAMFVKSEFSE